MTEEEIKSKEKKKETKIEKNETEKIEEKLAEQPKNVPTTINEAADKKAEAKEGEKEISQEENKIKIETKAKKKETPKAKKYEAVAHGVSMPISKKQGMYICRFIKGKNIDSAIQQLSQVKEMKRAIPFKGEIPHRKEEGIMSGRYPIKACGYFINLLKGLKGNAVVNGLELETTKIYFASANWASRPQRSQGRSAKRTHVLLKAKEITIQEAKQ